MSEYLINRNAVILKAKQPVLDWSNNLPDLDELNLTLDRMREECHVYLIPEHISSDHVRKYLQKNHKYLFEMELWSWCTNPELWPKKRDFNTFKKWFDIEIHSMVIDTLDEVIMKEEM